MTSDIYRKGKRALVNTDEEQSRLMSGKNHPTHFKTSKGLIKLKYNSAICENPCTELHLRLWEIE